ncbi:MAG: 50S ribosomal protein L10 [Clostridia bacterium]|nr:50S ribosomal protein L10 [Clostridia bacterium]
MADLQHLSPQQQQNREIVKEIKELIQNSDGFVVVDYKGLTVAQDTELRKQFRENNVDYKVLKNTLVRIALNELDYHQFDESLNGPTAVAFSKEEAITAAKLVFEGTKKYKNLQIKCGMFEKNFADATLVEKMAQIPGKQALLSMLVSVLSAPVRGLAVALNAIAEKQTEANN